MPLIKARHSEQPMSLRDERTVLLQSDELHVHKLRLSQDPY